MEERCLNSLWGQSFCLSSFRWIINKDDEVFGDSLMFPTSTANPWQCLWGPTLFLLPELFLIVEETVATSSKLLCLGWYLWFLGIPSLWGDIRFQRTAKYCFLCHHFLTVCIKSRDIHSQWNQWCICVHTNKPRILGISALILWCGVFSHRMSIRICTFYWSYLYTYYDENNSLDCYKIETQWLQFSIEFKSLSLFSSSPGWFQVF